MKPTLLVAVLVASSLSCAQSFTNASFESPDIAPGTFAKNPTTLGVGWTGNAAWGIADGQGSWGSGANSGTQYAFLQSSTSDNGNVAGAISQVVSGFNVGERYRIIFSAARRNGNVGANQATDLSIKLDSTSTIFGPSTPVGQGQWFQYASNAFLATSTSHAFTFLVANPVDDRTVLLDDISIEVVPEPTTLSILGLISALAIKRKLRKHNQ